MLSQTSPLQMSEVQPFGYAIVALCAQNVNGV